MTIDIPLDDADAVLTALRSQATWYRNDLGHAPEDVIKLRALADRLDSLADELDDKANAEFDRQWRAEAIAGGVPVIMLGPVRLR